MGRRQRRAIAMLTTVAALAASIVLSHSPPPATGAAPGPAAFHGSVAQLAINSSVVKIAATPSGQGYWLVGADGGIFAFGDARFAGSTGALRLNRPVVGMT